MEVKIVKTLRDIKNTTSFKYTNENLETKRELTVLANNLDAAGVQEMLMLLAKRVGEMNLKSKEETARFGDSGKFHLQLSLSIFETRVNIFSLFFKFEL